MGRLALDGALAGGAAPARRRQIWSVLLLLVGIAYPFVLTGGGYIDAAANAYTYVLLALGLNIVVGFSGLLDLGYAAFFAIGAYTYGAAASGHIKIPWSDFWTPFLFLGQVLRVPVEGGTDVVQFQFSFWVMLLVGALVCACFGVFFGAPTLRLRGDYLAIVTLGLRRDRAGGRAQLGLVHQRGPGHGRDPHAEAVRLRLRVLARSRTTSWGSPWWRSPCSSPSGSRSRGSGGRGWRSARTSWRRAPWG